jgi:hypothetical protein
MDYEDGQAALAALDCDLGEAFWTLIRANLALFDGVANWVHVIHGPIEPLIDDPAFIAEAAALLPESLDRDSLVGLGWAEAVKAKTGAKGKALFLPLRRALTGMDHGPEMGPMLKLIGRLLPRQVKALTAPTSPTRRLQACRAGSPLTLAARHSVPSQRHAAPSWISCAWAGGEQRQARAFACRL